MRNATWVCFRCRTTARRIASVMTVVPCRTCGRGTHRLWYGYRVPSPRDVKGWASLLATLHKELVRAEDHRIRWQAAAAQREARITAKLRARSLAMSA